MSCWLADFGARGKRFRDAAAILAHLTKVKDLPKII
jgi:hypothetical protein